MSYTDIAQSLRPHKTLILISLALAGVMGTAAALYPIPYIVTLSIPNDEDYFSLTEIKRLKNRLPVVASKLLENEPESDLKKMLQNTATETKWIEKNLTPVFSVTKADAKDLVDYKESSGNYYVAWLNVSETSKDRVLAERAARWVAELLCKLSHARKIEKYLIDVRKESDLRLIAIYNELMDADKNQEKLQQNIKLVEKLRSKYPENLNDQSHLQLYLPGEQRQDGRRDGRQDGRQDGQAINDNAESLDFFSLAKQLIILESRYQQQQSKLERLELERKLQEIKRRAAASELEGFSQGPIDGLFKDQKVIYEFWPSLKFDTVVDASSPDWLKNYASNTQNSLKMAELISKSQFDNQIARLDGVSAEKRFVRLQLILGAFMFGLCLPALFVFFPSFMKKLLSSTPE